jgi:hypothetical protein
MIKSQVLNDNPISFEFSTNICGNEGVLIEEKVLQSFTLDPLCLRKIRDQVRYLLRDKAYKCRNVFCRGFYPLKDRDITKGGIYESEYWCLQTAFAWLKTVPFKKITISRLGIDPQNKICTIGLVIALHDVKPKLYKDKSLKRYLHMIWTVNGFLLNANISNCNDMIL